jgi:hypothetical protein
MPEVDGVLKVLLLVRVQFLPGIVLQEWRLKRRNRIRKDHKRRK